MKDLTQSQSQKLFEKMMTNILSEREMAKILCTMAEKGETTDEIIGAIRAMRAQMQTIPIATGAIDTCGTGGDRKGTFNISTAVAFVVAGAGVRVAKHGNRKASSQCGSADVLEKLGVNIGLSPLDSQKVILEVGMVFLFAPMYHPAMRYVAPVRKKLGIRTIFNYLGPFCNPASVRRQVIGVPNTDMLEKLTHVAKELDYEYMALVTSDDGMDEISPAAQSNVHIIKHSRVTSLRIDPKKYNMHNTVLDEIVGGDVQKNAFIIHSILKGKKGTPRDTVLLNAAMALLVAGKASSFKQGIGEATKSIDSGRALNILKALIHSSNNHEHS